MLIGTVHYLVEASVSQLKDHNDFSFSKKLTQIFGIFSTTTTTTKPPRRLRFPGFGKPEVDKKEKADQPEHTFPTWEMEKRRRDRSKINQNDNNNDSGGRNLIRVIAELAIKAAGAISNNGTGTNNGPSRRQ